MTKAPTSPSNWPRLALFVSFSGTGGVERVTLNLLEGLAGFPVHVDLLTVVARRGQAPQVDWPNVRVVPFKTRHSQLAIPELVHYLRKENPDVLMVAKDRAVRASILAHAWSGTATRLVGQLHMNMQGYLANQPWYARWLRTLPMRLLFPRLDLIIGVSEGVRKDTLELTGMPEDRVIAIKNPVITPEMDAQGRAPCPHPWLEDSATVPVIVAAGRLTPEKDFPTLIRAFRRLREQRPARLLVLGEGPLEASLKSLIETLHLKEEVDLVGFQANPFAFMSRAALFAMTSAWEGSGNVLVEALAFGVPCVSTDCPYGPRETLVDGHYGPLVPVGDDAALAEAMLRTLDQPLPPTQLLEAVTDFRIETSAYHYLRALFPGHHWQRP